MASNRRGRCGCNPRRESAVAQLFSLGHYAHHKMHELDFMFETGPVGYFEEPEYPHCDGRYRYMPYRSYSHYAMHEAHKGGGIPRCYFDVGEVRVSFGVRDFPEYGVLELYDFKSSQKAVA